MGFSDCSSVDSSKVSSSLNLKATELRLGLPGSESPKRDPKLVEKPLFPLQSSSGNKRGFSHTTDEFSESGGQPVRKEILPLKGLQLSASGPNESSHNQIRPIDTKANNPPAAKAQVVGWPPIRSFRRNTLCKNNDELDRKPGPGALFVKVSMDGAPYLRKVDLRTYSVYQDLSSALEKMFSCFTIGQCGSHGAPGREMLSERKLRDLLHGSEYVLTYEDKDGDWMLVGDVPWEMFIESCKRMRIMKSSDAIGLGVSI